MSNTRHLHIIPSHIHHLEETIFFYYLNICIYCCYVAALFFYCIISFLINFIFVRSLILHQLIIARFQILVDIDMYQLCCIWIWGTRAHTAHRILGSAGWCWVSRHFSVFCVVLPRYKVIQGTYKCKKGNQTQLLGHFMQKKK